MENENKKKLLIDELTILEKMINNIGENYIDVEDEVMNELFYSSLYKMKEGCKNIQFVLEKQKKEN